MNIVNSCSHSLLNMIGQYVFILIKYYWPIYFYSVSIWLAHIFLFCLKWFVNVFEKMVHQCLFKMVHQCLEKVHPCLEVDVHQCPSYFDYSILAKLKGICSVENVWKQPEKKYHHHKLWIHDLWIIPDVNKVILDHILITNWKIIDALWICRHIQIGWYISVYHYILCFCIYNYDIHMEIEQEK